MKIWKKKFVCKIGNEAVGWSGEVLWQTESDRQSIQEVSMETEMNDENLTLFIVFERNC